MKGYARQFRGLKSWLESQSEISKYIEIVAEEDKGITGNFEVRIGDERQLIHSKKTAGQGRAESTKERQMIAEFIQEYLNENVL
jgi:hypothetical protein